MQRNGTYRRMASLTSAGTRPPTALVTDQRGASALEFALIAPILAIALLGTVDVGRALTEQMTLGSLLRTAAQAALAGGDKVLIERVLDAANDDASIEFIVGEPGCSCPESPAVLVSCYATCAGSASTSIHFSLTANKEFVGVFLPPIVLSKTLQVQVR